MPIPIALQEITSIELKTLLPNFNTVKINLSLPTLVYNTYNIDPLWHKNINANRILLLEPLHFEKYPISEKVLNWILQLTTNNITDIQIFCGSFSRTHE
jgi:deoxyribodipyrimidine photo-lyase